MSAISHRDRESSRSRSSEDDADRKRIYVGKLPCSVKNRDVEELFSSFGRIVNVRLFPARRDSMPFAFVTFENARDASDAIKDRNGYVYRGERIRVEMPHGSAKSTALRRYGRGNRSQYRVFITGLAETASWQDLKDHMRKAGDVCFANVFRDGSGVVEYNSYDDMKYAVRKLDGTKFRSYKGDTSKISVSLDDDSSSSRSRSRSRSYTPTAKRRARSRSSSGSVRSRSRSRSPRRESRRDNHRHSDSRSRSRSPLKHSHRRRGARYSPDSSPAERHRSRCR